MTEYRRVCGVVSFWLVCLGGLSLLSGCSNFKQMIGLDQPMPDEIAVESRAPMSAISGSVKAPSGTGPG